MKRCIFLMVLGLLVFSGAAAQDTLYVAVKSVNLKSSSGVFAVSQGTLELGEPVRLVQKDRDWMEVQSLTQPGLSGWVPESGLTSKKIIRSSGTTLASEIALAGKGFTGDIEKAYGREDRINYAGVDAVESIRVSEAELFNFLVAGGLWTTPKGREYEPPFLSRLSASPKPPSGISPWVSSPMPIFPSPLSPAVSLPKSTGLSRSFLEEDLRGALSEMDEALENDQRETTPEDEYYLGRGVAGQILRSSPLDGDVEGLTRFVNEICQALVIHSSQPLIFNGYHAAILDSPEIEAFATPGGHIFLSMGLVKIAPSEDALAGVIAHEMAHIQLHHGLALIEDQRLTEDLTAVARRASEIATRNVPAKERLQVFGQDILTMVNTLMLNGYAQKQEYEADALALDLLDAAGYDPRGLVEMLQALERVEKESPREMGWMNSTHPSPRQRLRQVEPQVQGIRSLDTRQFRDKRYRSLLEKEGNI